MFCLLVGLVGGFLFRVFYMVIVRVGGWYCSYLKIFLFVFGIWFGMIGLVGVRSGIFFLLFFSFF